MSRLYAIVAAALAFHLIPIHAEAKPPTYTLEQKCAHPELFLSSVAVEKIPEVIKKRCRKREHTPTMENLLQWGCEYRDFYRNAIFASYGRKFRKKKWQRVFDLAVWYQHDPQYSDKRLSKTAWANVKKLRKSCIRTARFKRDRKRLESWILALQRGDHETASKMMSFPFNAVGEVEPRCNRLTGGGKAVTDCFDGFKSAVKDMAPGWLKEENAVFRINSVEGRLDLEDRKISLKGLRSFQVVWVPGDLACAVGVNPKHSESFVEDCGGYGMSITIYTRGNRIAAAHFNGGSACPYVYVAKGDTLSFQGEILRNVIGARMRRSQTLPIEIDLTDEVIEVVVTEEKDERTFLDAVSLIVDGERLLPIRCADEPDIEYCVANRSYKLLDKGDRLSLRFRIPAKLDRGKTALEMTGFYIPGKPGRRATPPPSRKAAN